MTRWGRVERFACAQVNTGDQDVDVNPAIRFVVLDRRQVDVFRLQPSKRHRLEVLQNRSNLVGGRGLFCRPRDHCTPVSMLEWQRVGHRREKHRIAPQYRHPCPWFTCVIVRAHEVGRSTGTAARTVGKELNQHRRPPWPQALEVAVTGAAGAPPVPLCCAAGPALPPVAPTSRPIGIRSGLGLSG